jgi:hypothetical protein
MIGLSLALGGVCQRVGHRRRSTAGRRRTLQLGLAFQGADDLLDVTAFAREIAGQDAGQGRGQRQGDLGAPGGPRRCALRGPGAMAAAGERGPWPVCLPPGPALERVCSPWRRYMWQSDR